MPQFTNKTGRPARKSLSQPKKIPSDYILSQTMVAAKQALP
jgi:hypothetical protein